MRYGHVRVGAAAKLLMLGLMLCGGKAAAQDTAWPPRGDQRLAPWFDAVRDEFEASEVVVHAAQDSDGCVSIDEALKVARTLGVARALCVEVTRVSGATLVKVQLARAGEQAGEGTAPVVHGDFAAAAREAYRLADVALTLGNDGLLRVQTTPQGALVSLDGEPIGHAPLDRHVRPGNHDVSIALEGFAGERQSVEITRGRISEVNAKLLRTTADSEADARDTGPTKASPLNWWLGGALVLGSAPLLILPLRTLARDGNCAEHNADGQCTGRVEFGARSAVLLGAGLAALIAGASILVVQPFTVDVEASPEHALLTLRARL